VAHCINIKIRSDIYYVDNNKQIEWKIYHYLFALWLNFLIHSVILFYVATDFFTRKVYSSSSALQITGTI